MYPDQLIHGCICSVRLSRGQTVFLVVIGVRNDFLLDDGMQAGFLVAVGVRTNSTFLRVFGLFQVQTGLLFTVGIRTSSFVAERTRTSSLVALRVFDIFAHDYSSPVRIPRG